MTRRSVWSQPRIQKLLESFVPAADEVWRLHHRDGPECDLFRKIAEHGHYAGRTEPTDTRQGIYATAPSGVLLASINTRSAERVAEMLETALRRWEELPDEQRWLDPALLDEAPLRTRSERAYPAGGLILRVSSRDLPRNDIEPEGDVDDARRRRRRSERWQEQAWNQDYAWFTRAEARMMVPDEPRVGAVRDVPDAIALRLACFHLVDNVRGQTSSFDREDVEEARLRVTVVERDGDVLMLTIEGHSRAVVEDREGRLVDYPRSIEADLVGRAVYDAAEQRFTAFDLAAVGTRRGETRYNGRDHDPGPAPIGFAFTLAGDDPPVAPAFVWQYGWRR